MSAPAFAALDGAKLYAEKTCNACHGTDAKAKHGAAASNQDWAHANLWAEQVWQYQVKAADIGLRAKTFLEQKGAK